jgi:nitroreductase
MNTKLNCIFNRRSVRSYIQNKPIPEETIKDILEAAMACPTACNMKAYDFILLDNKDKLKQVSDCLPYGKFLASASLGIVVCGNIDKVNAGELSYLLQDCSAAIENILIAVSELELGACWLGVHPRKERIESIKNIFSLPDNIIPVSVISIGYPDKTLSKARTQYDENKIHRNIW